jgi:hypothetical protein
MRKGKRGVVQIERDLDIFADIAAVECGLLALKGLLANEGKMRRWLWWYIWMLQIGWWVERGTKEIKASDHPGKSHWACGNFPIVLCIAL